MYPKYNTAQTSTSKYCLIKINYCHFDKNQSQKIKITNALFLIYEIMIARITKTSLVLDYLQDFGLFEDD